MIALKIFCNIFLLAHTINCYLIQDQDQKNCQLSSVVYNSKKGECMKCQDGCQTCNTSECLSCSRNYLNKDSRCVEKCPEGHYSSNFNGMCYKCPYLNCLECNFIGQCIKCQSGFDLKEGLCFKDICELYGIYDEKLLLCKVDCRLEDLFQRNKCNYLEDQKEKIDTFDISSQSIINIEEIESIKIINILDQAYVIFILF